MPYDDRPSPTRQETFTVLARVTQEPALRRALAGLPPDVFADAELGVHFARLVVIPRDATCADSQVWLAFESNFDTSLADETDARRAHLSALAERAHGPLGALFACCDGLEGAPSPGELAAYWERNVVPATATYQGHSERPIARIRLESRLREVILTFLETADRASPPELFDRIRKHVRARAATDPALAGLDVDAPPPALPDPAVRSRHLRENWTSWIESFSPGDVLPIVARAPQVLLEWQRHDVVYDVRGHQEQWTPADREAFAAIAATEDHFTQNALTHVVPLRGGRGRLSVLEHAHAIVDRVSKSHFQYIGQLGTIPSIHFAKWLLFESDQRLLFLSNYDKSWESYLGDFVDKAPEGLNLAWSCTREYPRTVGLAFEGAKDEETFKAWGRAYQVPTQVFYSAYTELTIETINNNTWIRYRLHQPADDSDLQSWFRRLT
jgi:hypothetical protein